jgi:hypothetical protein
MTASNDVASLASVFTSLLAGYCLTTKSALLRNGLQQWRLLRLSCLHQKRLFTTTSYSDCSVCLQTLSRLDWLVFQLCRYGLRTDPTENILKDQSLFSWKRRPHLQNTQWLLTWTKIGSKTRNYCACEGQHQITALLSLLLGSIRGGQETNWRVERSVRYMSVHQNIHLAAMFSSCRIITVVHSKVRWGRFKQIHAIFNAMDLLPILA